MRDKILGVLGVLGLTGLLVAGCSGQEPAHSDGPPPQFFQEKFHIDSDGRTVRCLYKEFPNGYGTGVTMSCDWATARVHTK